MGMAMAYTNCKVFTATKFQDRERLGETVTAWLAANPGIDIVETVTLQSSDNSFHCLTICIFHRTGAKAA